jgi:hypothetical protein
MIPNIKNTTLQIEDNNKADVNKTELLKHNIKIIVIYSLILAIAFGLNGLALSLFNKISGYNSTIFFQIIYLLCLILLIIIITYFSNVKIGF